MSDECIHGFPVANCDTCRPREAPPEPPRASAPKSSRGAAPTTAPRTRVKSSVTDPRTQRIFHVTHIDNLREILATGAIVATPDAIPVDLTTDLIRTLRATATLHDGTTAAGRVAFSADPEVSWWRDIREGALDVTRWSDAAREIRATELVALLTTVGAVAEATGNGTDEPGLLIADGDAAATVTQFRGDAGTVLALAEGVRAKDEHWREAEILAGPRVPLATITAVAVANQPMKARVEDELRAIGETRRIMVSPGWFLAT